MVRRVTIQSAELPTITSQSINQLVSHVVSVGGNATFSVTATGTAPLTYQWFFGSTAVTDATNATLTLSNVQTNQAGSYSVVITNAHGSVTSSVASLTVNQLSQTITFAALPTKLTTDAPFALTATASSGLPVSYTSSDTSVATVSGSTVTLKGPGTTTLTASQPGNATFAAAPAIPRTLTVNGPPFITTQPVSQTVSVGGNATFSVAATGTAPLSYQWTKNGVNIIGATSATYSINNVQLTDAGLYGVVVSNASGSEHSSAPLFILPTGSFLGNDTFSNPRNQTLWGVNDFAHPGSALTESGGKLVLTGTANAGNHFEVSAARVWQTGLAPFGADWTAEVEVTVPNAVFTGANQKAKWELLVANAADPTDILDLRLQSFAAGGQFVRSETEINGVDGPTLNNATGAGETVRLRLTWTANTKEMRLAWFTGSTSNYLGSYNLGTGSPTEFANCTGFVLGLLGGTEGMSPRGLLVADNFTTTQVTPPLITTQPLGQTVSAGGNATFSVTATSTAPLSYQWRFNGANLIEATNSTLSFTATNRSFIGAYSVLVTSLGGSVTSSTAGLRVLVPQRLQPPQRLSEGQFLLRFGDFDGGLAGAGGLSAFEIYATTNLLNTNSWVRLTNDLSIVNGQVQIEDAGAPGLPRRFYRIIER